MKTSIQEIMMLRDADIQPKKEVLKNALGGSYLLFDELMDRLKTLDVAPEWNYYRDGKAWLCKVVHKKKTVFWLSVWEEYFKVVFYFTAKTCTGIADLEIDGSIKEDFKGQKNIGKFMPLIINVTESEQIENVIKIINYKKSLK